jgi:hypothetical protein
VVEVVAVEMVEVAIVEVVDVEVDVTVEVMEVVVVTTEFVVLPPGTPIGRISAAASAIVTSAIVPSTCVGPIVLR